MNKGNFLNSKAFGIWSELADGLIVNLLFLVTCIPIITYGPAKTALYETSVKWVKTHDGGWKAYWESFKANLKGSMVPGLLVLALAVLAYLDFKIGLAVPALKVISIMLVLLFYMLKEQMFLFNARISCSLGQLIHNTVSMTLKHPLKSLVGSVPWILPVLVLFYYPDWFIRIAVVWVFAYFSLSAWIMTKIMYKDYVKVFKTINLENDNRDEVMDNDMV